MAMEEITGNCEPWKLIKKVLPQHTDHAGVMWHGSYLAWLEEARIEALEEVGLAYSKLSFLGFEIPVVSLEINYLSPLHHGDTVVLESWPLLRKGVRFPWRTKFFRDGDQLVAEAQVDLVVVAGENNNFHVLRHLPEKVEVALELVQQGPKSLN